MREMNATGTMPNKGRMIVCSYFTQDLKQDWRSGAHYFEEKLIDYDVHANYCNWQFTANLGPYYGWAFNTLTQSSAFDKNGEYIRKWVPELSKVSDQLIHSPWDMTMKEQNDINLKI